MNFLSEKKYSVRACETDHLGYMRLSAIFQIMQETAEMNAKKLGFSYDYVVENNELWVLSRIKAKFEKAPKRQDELIVKTWPVGKSRIFGLRDYTIGLNSNLIGKVTSSWVLIDTKRRSIKRMRDFPKSNLASVFTEMAPKVKVPKDLELIDRRIVKKSELDINNHVNDAIYFNWVTDSLSTDLYESFMIDEITANYINETKLDDQIDVYHGIADNNLTVIIKNETNGKTAFSAVLSLAPRN